MIDFKLNTVAIVNLPLFYGEHHIFNQMQSNCVSPNVKNQPSR